MELQWGDNWQHSKCCPCW